MSHFKAAIVTAAKKGQADWEVPASVSLAQFAIESAYGTKMPTGSNNPFGIKAVGDQPYVETKTLEYIHGSPVYVVAKFRKFTDFNEAFDEHARLLATNILYAPAMHAWKVDHNLDVGVRLMAKHYATAPDYATVVLSIIRSQHLQQYDS